jgi:hypothetical protein
MSRWMKLCFPCLSVLLACGDMSAVDDPSFDRWCGDKLCNWQLDDGNIERVGTWSRWDWAVAFTETPTQISQLQTRNADSCLQFDMIADVSASARMALRLDFGDDGMIDFEQQIPAAAWRSLSFQVPTPADHGRVRYILNKQGTGKAVVAQIYVSNQPACSSRPVLLPDGSGCSAALACESGLCADGQCYRCSERGCADGQVCTSSAQCADGLCVAGRCSDCAASHSCPPYKTCEAGDQCARGRCVSPFVPSSLVEAHGSVREQNNASLSPGQCAECASAADCPGGTCVNGACADCEGDQQCAASAVCRYPDDYDAVGRSCLAPRPTPAPRGALCESDAECADQLRCSAAPGLAQRCGGACRSLLDCTQPGEQCVTGALAHWPPVLFAGEQSDVSDPANYVLTCYFPAELIGLVASHDAGQQ